ncbi:hypothetical protein DSM112329_03165 [Paraconexibacter sp. AEG42_29]|uniref:Polysaccharide biosynthesis protein n=1 Tax=Paraconexibacter sp. AEG42_29 TaxID=2997339 RepID=A0AAU7AXE3_9ACTN
MPGSPDHSPAARLRAGLQGLRGSDTGTAGALAGASLASNAIQLVFTVAVTRILGTDDYGALAALVSGFLVLFVAGQSLQAAAAREVALGRLGTGAELAATVRGWTRTTLLATVALAVFGVAVSAPLADLVGTPEHRWGAAALPATGALWLLVCVQRGVLQGLHALRPVGISIIWEAGVRLPVGLGLAAVAGVTGAFAASLVCFAAVAIGLARALEHRLGGERPPASSRPLPTLRGLVGNGWMAIVGLLLLAVLQNVDVIIARHQLGHDRAGSYAVAAVAAKSIVWVAVGVGLQLLPQATTRAAAGEDPRPVLFRALGVLVVVALPALLIFAAVPEPLLRTAFGPDTVDAAPALILLGLAMTLLAVAYLTVQFLIALGRIRFLGVLTVIIAAELTVLFGTDLGITAFAAVVAGVQGTAAAALLVLALLAAPSRARADR